MRNSFVLGGLLFLSSLIVPVFGAEATSSSEGTEQTAPFSVQAILPDNQLEDTYSYYYLLVEPKQTQELTLEVTNLTTETKQYHLMVSSGQTNSKGTIVYDQKEPEAFPVPKISDIVSLPEEIEVNSQETKQVTLQVTMPEEPFDGVLLGGITVEEVVETSEEAGVANQYRLVKGLLVTEDSEAAVYGHQQLILEEAGIGVGNEQIEAFVRFRNEMGEIYGPFSLAVTMQEKKTETPVLEEVVPMVTIAPYSTFQLPMVVPFEGLKAGDYVVTAIATFEDGTVQQFEQTVTLDEKELKEFTQQQTTKASIPQGWWVALGGVVLLTLLSGSYFLFLGVKNRRTGSH